MAESIEITKMFEITNKPNYICFMDRTRPSYAGELVCNNNEIEIFKAIPIWQANFPYPELACKGAFRDHRCFVRAPGVDNPHTYMKDDCFYWFEIEMP